MKLNETEEKIIKSFLANYYAVLKNVDYDGDGTVSDKELLSFLLRTDTPYAQAKEAVTNVFEILDKDKSGTITFDEILKYRR